ncbi:ADP-forming succinate--CoA ligase subunit beta [Myxococcota bacterium]|nr:ADP-forming succinate--CoA ligase subunit beta [Myxococcota bacterium]
MNIHEYQAKELLRRYGVSVLAGKVAFSAQEAMEAAREIGGHLWVVKAQIHAGGRGKGGGVKLARSPQEVYDLALGMLGMRLVTHQTGPEGQTVRRLYVEQGCDIARELYLGVVLDRATSRLVFMASTEGGVDIEEVAAHHPERIHKEWVDPAVGLADYQARNIAFRLGLKGSEVRSCVRFVQGLYRAVVESDCGLAEINPLVVTRSGEVIALDAKMNFDDNALFRHPDVEALRDVAEEEPAEVEAKKFDLSYIKLHGNIGCMVNGAGLAMGTMDIIKLHGGEPANFLDVGGGATTERVTAAFKIITSDPDVKAILVNIFGGIMKCDVIANGILVAVRDVGLKVPLVVRLEGTNVELGRRILSDSGLDVIPATGMRDAAEKVVAAAHAHGAH